LSDLPYHQTRPTIEDVAVSELLEDLVAERFSHQRIEVDLRTDIDADLPIVATDRTRLRLIVEQVLSNAQKFTVAGEVSVTAKVDDQQRVVVVIGDTGPGISRERIAASFDALAEPSGETEGEIPTGLGLYICKQLADRLGVILDIESEIGTGTTVRIILPNQPPR
jgi:signal transduction histidine kinase